MRNGIFPAVIAAAMFCVADGRAESPPPLDRSAVEDIVRDYLLGNPELIGEVLERLQAKQERERDERLRAALVTHRTALRRHPMSPVSGNGDGDVTVVEFFDYQCGYCKRSLKTMSELLEADKQVRVVWKEFPILGPPSRFAARAAMAAERQGRYLEFHKGLMSFRGRLTESAVTGVARRVGLDLARLRRDMDDPAIDAYLDETARLAGALGIQGTPAFVIGDTLVPGMIDSARMREIVANARGAAN